jgi:hypothetical protein
MPRFLLLLSACLVLSACSPVAWWKSVNEKAEELTTLQARYEALEKEHEELKLQHFRLESDYAELQAKVETKELAHANLQATGSLTGRRPAAIAYQVPHGLKPEELQGLAYEHFREGRFAEAAVTFEEFLTRPEAAVIHDPNAVYSAGVSWYQVGNLKKSKDLMEQARAEASGEQKEKIRKKADLWLRVIDRRLASVKHGG